MLEEMENLSKVEAYITLGHCSTGIELALFTKKTFISVQVLGIVICEYLQFTEVC